MDGYEQLASAIILQAVKDYRKAYKGRRVRRKTHEIQEIERFFLSEWFMALTNTDGSSILKRLEEEVMKK